MRDSIRRIAAAVGVVGLLAFSVVTIRSIAVQCGSTDASCLSAAVLFGVQQTDLPMMQVETNHAAPTTVHSDAVPAMADFLLAVIQATSVYLILLSVITLVVLELLELRYLRRLLQLKQT